MLYSHGAETPVQHHVTSILCALLVCGCAPQRPTITLGDGTASFAALSSDARFLAIADVTGSVRVFAVPSGEQLGQCEGFLNTYGGLSSRPLAMCSESGRIAFRVPDGVRVWDWRSGGIRDFSGQEEIFTNIVITQNRLVTVSGGLTYDRLPPATRRAFEPEPVAIRQPLSVREWDLATGREAVRWQNDDTGILFSCLSADGRTIATLGVPGMPRRLAEVKSAGQLRRELSTWDMHSGTRTWSEVEDGPFMPVHLALSSDSRLLYSSGFAPRRQSKGAPGNLRSLHNGERRMVEISGATFSADDRSLNLASDYSMDPGPVLPLFGLSIPPQPKPHILLKRVDVSTGRLIMSKTMRVAPRTYPIAWTDDLSMFVDRDLQLWKLKD